MICCRYFSTLSGTTSSVQEQRWKQRLMSFEAATAMAWYPVRTRLTGCLRITAPGSMESGLSFIVASFWSPRTREEVSERGFLGSGVSVSASIVFRSYSLLFGDLWSEIVAVLSCVSWTAQEEVLQLCIFSVSLDQVMNSGTQEST